MITNQPTRIVRGKKCTYTDLWYSDVEALADLQMLADAIFKFAEVTSGIDRQQFVDFIHDQYMRKLPDMMESNILEITERYED